MATEQTDIVHVSTFASLPRTVRGLPLVVSTNAAKSTLLYCNGNSVYLRDVDDITKTDIYTEHSTLTSVAKYSPSGYYIASGDQSGKVRIWDTTQSTHLLKAEYSIINGPLRDIAWDAESKRLAAVGEGRERFGHVILFDTGTSNGNLAGQSRPMSSIDFRPTRPFRLASGSEDYTVALFEGPPFKFKLTKHEHSRFVHCVRYNKEGTQFASAGADGRVVLWEGVEGEKAGELADASVKGGAAHAGGVFALCWSPCGTRLVTASGDKTVKIWSAAEQQLEKTISFDDNISNQQLAVVWTTKWIVSVSLAGFLTYIDADTGAIERIVKGHNRPITAFVLTADGRHLFTADFEGNMTRWETASGVSERVEPSPHTTQISGLALTADETLVSVGWDDSVAFTPAVRDSIAAVKSEKKTLTSQPRGVACAAKSDLAAVVAHRHIFVFAKDELKSTHEFAHDGNCVALSSDGKLLAVGSMSNKVFIYDVADYQLAEKKTLTHAGAITSLAFSPDDSRLVVTDTARRVVPYAVDGVFKSASEKDWTFHTARVNAAAWSPNGRFIASAGLDTSILVYDTQHSGEPPLMLRRAHPMSAINGIVWLDDTTLLTVGHDSNVKRWSVKLPI